VDEWRDRGGQAEPLRKSETGYVGKAAKDGSEVRMVSAQRSRREIDETNQVLTDGKGQIRVSSQK